MAKPCFFLILTILVVFNACSPRLKSVITAERPALAYDSEVFVVSKEASVPKGAQAVGKLTIGDTGFTIKCRYDYVLEQAKLKAREHGANVVKIIEHKKPNFWGSSCHRLKVVFYHLGDTSELTMKVGGRE